MDNVRYYIDKNYKGRLTRPLALENTGLEGHFIYMNICALVLLTLTM